MENFDEIEKFSSIIIDKVNAGKIDYLDAIITYCEEKELEVDSIVGLLSPFIVSKLEEEAIDNRIIKSSSKRLCFV